ncbi:hypothetical protein [Salinisphaera sp. Q1T1-3]|uniref:hypothetical protein n=1 Tax=Salinisphaera sp. Q1T1-3 TaxID=2321229 RepID=UPI000E76D939|nr:hypothetical protein [Salinisphaera sp. Q1T1-3]RJS95201.1 hypothetical protein D3260_01190 [Salinisphaera sp. Q1T1-3]
MTRISAGALRHENILIVPDMYRLLPGSPLYIEAANGFLPDRLLFGSSYSFQPIEQSIADARQLGFTDAAPETFLGGNAKHALSSSCAGPYTRNRIALSDLLFGTGQRAA